MRRKRLDIGIVIPELAKYGGAERLLIECVRRWQTCHDITIYATRFDRDILREHGVRRSVELVRISPYYEGPHSILLNCVLLPKIWEQEIGVHDIYHTHLWSTHLLDLHPSVWYPHEPLRILHDLRYNQSMEGLVNNLVRNIHIYPKYNYDKVTDVLFEAYLNSMDAYDKLGKPDRIVANSRYTASYLEEVYQRKVDDVVYPGVNVDDFIYTPPEENIVLTIGQLWPHKRIRLIIEAVKHVEDVQLYVVGNGPDAAKLKKTARSLGVSDRVFFLHGLTNLEVQILFSRCMAVVFTPIKEPFGIVPLEAMAAGKPLIGVNEGGFTEVVDDSCAFLVPPQPLAIAERIRYLRDNKDVAAKMGLAGLEKVRAYNWDRTAEELIAIIEDTHARWEKSHRKRASRRGGDRTLFGAQYYCWYGDGVGSAHWNDNLQFGGVTDMPELGYYASSHGTVIEEHLRTLEAAGLDFLILNLHLDSDGVNAYELAVIENIFSVAEEIGSKLRLAVQLCFYDARKKDAVTVLKLIGKVLSRREHYLRMSGKPVLFFFWTGVLDGNKSFISTVDEYTEGFIRVATSLRMYSRKTEHKKTFGLFDGFTLFSPLEMCAPEKWTKLWQEAYDNCDAGAMGLQIITVSPGYDDSHLKDPQRQGNIYRTVDRDGGATYRKMLDFTLSQQRRPHMVVVSTFNEYHENTHIEASVNNGSRYMDMTRAFISQGRKRWRKSR
ncbi:MAG TPA: glycosyltransferase [Deltaproteobacteria bacterium]|nr:glycosyltransferase [Deltaproteobacteria bacterium]